jgi:hypothetical protein
MVMTLKAHTTIGPHWTAGAAGLPGEPSHPVPGSAAATDCPGTGHRSDGVLWLGFFACVATATRAFGVSVKWDVPCWTATSMSFCPGCAEGNEVGPLMPVEPRHS